jgi:hypothetical protein
VYGCAIDTHTFRNVTYLKERLFGTLPSSRHFGSHQAKQNAAFYAWGGKTEHKQKNKKKGREIGREGNDIKTKHGRKIW